jgi:hypothetical protein
MRRLGGQEAGRLGDEKAEKHLTGPINRINSIN